jgi:hypothetical protein
MVVGNENVPYIVQTDGMTMPKPFYALQIIVAKNDRSVEQDAMVLARCGNEICAYP